MCVPLPAKRAAHRAGVSTLVAGGVFPSGGTAHIHARHVTALAVRAKGSAGRYRFERPSQVPAAIAAGIPVPTFFVIEILDSSVEIRDLDPYITSNSSALPLLVHK